jgi:protein-S-isoprenylcysteine O-methyltransferase Ste14
MSDAADNPNVMVHPPIALGMALVISFALNWIYPLPFLPPQVSHLELGLVLILMALILVRWAAQTFRKARTNILTNQATTVIVCSGPFAFSRNPIYVAGLLGMVGFAVAANSLWFLAAMVIIFFVLRYGVIAREEIYLERKFGAEYLDYKTKVRRWL